MYLRGFSKTKYPPLPSMQELGRIHGAILKTLKNFIKPGISGLDIENKFLELAKKYNVKSACKGKKVNNSMPYPTNLCVSINNEAIHVFPTADQIVHYGDLVTVDLVLVKNGIYTDAAFTMLVLEKENSNEQDSDSASYIDKTLISKIELRKKLLNAAYEALQAGVSMAKQGKRVGDIGNAVFSVVKKYGFDVLYDYGGHGIGYDMWEEPFIPNYGQKNTGPKLKQGMYLAIEPLITAGTSKLKFIDDWRTKIADGSDFVQVEATVMVGKNGPVVITPTLKGDLGI